MKNIIKVILCIAIIIFSLGMSFVLLAKHHEEHQYDENKIAVKRVYDPSSVLHAAIERKNWDNLALSENFKNKYKTRNDIIPDRSKYTVFSEGYDYVGDKRCIMIVADTPDSIFDPYGERSVTTYFYFDYILNSNNEIDDIVLVKTEKVNSMSGKVVEE